MLLSLAAVIYKASRPHIAVLGKVPNTNYFRNVKRFKDVETRPDVLIVRIDGPLYFANVEYVKNNLDNWVEEKGNVLKMIVLNMESVTTIDSTGAHELEEWINTWRKSNIDVCITGTRGPVRDILSKWNLIACIGEKNIFADDNTAICCFDESLDKESLKKLNNYVLQSNVKNK